MKQTIPIFSHDNPIHTSKLHDDFPFATVNDKSYGHYNKYVSQEQFDDLIDNN